MQIKVFTLPAQSSELMEEEVNLFLRQHKVMTVDRQFNPSGGGYCIYKNGNKQNLLPFLYQHWAIFLMIHKHSCLNQSKSKNNCYYITRITVITS